MRTRKRNIEKEEYEEGGEGMRKTKEEEQGGYPIYGENERSKVLPGRPVVYIWLHLYFLSPTKNIYLMVQVFILLHIGGLLKHSNL